MGYRGKVVEQERARELRARSWTLQEIADELGVAKSSVSLWVRDVAFTPRERTPGTGAARNREPNVLARRKADEVAALRQAGLEQVGSLSDRDLLIAGTALYAGEGAKRDGRVSLANSDPRFVGLFCQWFRRFFNPDESRLRCRLYLHEGLDLAAAMDRWVSVTGVPSEQFNKPYRATPDVGIRHNKHPHGCLTVSYGSAAAHRAVMGLVDALLSKTPPGPPP